MNQCNQFQICSSGYARGKQNNINRIKVTKKIKDFFLNGDIKHHGVLLLFDNRKLVRHVSILTFCCSYKGITKFPTEQVNYKSQKVSHKDVLFKNCNSRQIMCLISMHEKNVFTIQADSVKSPRKQLSVCCKYGMYGDGS